jgi:hypothetical protein
MNGNLINPIRCATQRDCSVTVRQPLARTIVRGLRRGVNQLPALQEISTAFIECDLRIRMHASKTNLRLQILQQLNATIRIDISYSFCRFTVCHILLHPPINVAVLQVASGFVDEQLPQWTVHFRDQIRPMEPLADPNAPVRQTGLDPPGLT